MRKIMKCNCYMRKVGIMKIQEYKKNIQKQGHRKIQKNK